MTLFPESASARAGWRLLLAWLLLNALLLTPEPPWAGFPPRHWLALEAPLLLGLLLLMPASRLRQWACAGVALIGLSIALGALGDGLMQAMQGRSINLYTDLSLLPILIELLVANLGLALTLAVTCALGLALFAVGWALSALLAASHRPRLPRGLGVALLAFGAGGLALQHAGRLEATRIGSPALGFVTFEWQRAMETRHALAAFGGQLENDPGARALPGLAGVDVVLGFIESYGVAAIEREPFADEIRPRLARMESELAASGLSMVTGRVTASTLGGQSWLNHATLLSGLPITSQLRFELMLNRHRSTLVDDFSASAHRTLAVMPGIIRDWPEGRQLGYDEIHTADSLGYRGPPMGWASMPDQFTWKRVGDYLDAASASATGASSHATFVELATLSSHAPWSPVITLVDWDSVGDGQVFSRWAGAGDDYASLWQNTEAMRAHYAPAIDYALQAAAGFAERQVGEHTLMLILGDHQAAPSIIGPHPGRDVPLHVISGDPALLAGFLHNGFRPGALPPGPEAAIPMSQIRALLHRIYAAPPALSRPDAARGS
ncbi:alkaline phosphatase [Salinicola sp. JS01]|uniref:alkaline phosphatase n=1 Tax=Salinicola sp. JS01 TaxID=3050071 RepID=UPI00255BB6E9|nr:alkaline phosphatase [Salinicola sp. JS01]WIX34006.1 alkaline phosphatase [Salinicola sp. JS01]